MRKVLWSVIVVRFGNQLYYYQEVSQGTSIICEHISTNVNMNTTSETLVLQAPSYRCYPFLRHEAM
jgi:hypothetical protein